MADLNSIFPDSLRELTNAGQSIMIMANHKTKGESMASLQNSFK